MRLKSLLAIAVFSAMFAFSPIVVGQQGQLHSVLERPEIAAPTQAPISRPVPHRATNLNERVLEPTPAVDGSSEFEQRPTSIVDQHAGSAAPRAGGDGLRIGPPNSGVQYGGGQGARFGTERFGVQYGGGQGVRYGTPNFGVQYGNGEGARFGTPNIGVQYGGGQILRWGTPNAGVKIGGGEGFRIGTTTRGIQFGTGNGLQIGRIRAPRN